MKIGDSVSVLEEDLRGKIISILGDVVQVEDSFGFTYSFPKNKILPQNQSFYDEIPVVKKEEPKRNISKKHTKNVFQLDLHFDQLVSNPNEYDSWERLFIQKEKLQNTLDFCRENRIKNIEIIHGLGDGTVQEMVYQVLHSAIDIEFEENEFFKHSSGSVAVNIL